MEETSALSARNWLPCQNECTKNAKKSNEPLLGFGTKTVSCTSAEREKIYKNKNKSMKKGQLNQSCEVDKNGF